MPKQYLSMKQRFQKQGLPEKSAASKSAAIYVSQGKNPKSRSQRAKALKEK